LRGTGVAFGADPRAAAAEAGADARLLEVAEGRRGVCAGARFCFGEVGFFDK